VTEAALTGRDVETLQVSELIEHLRQLLAMDVGEVWVEGELASLHRSRPGHLYFDLKDEGGQLRCAMFRRAAGRVSIELDDGLLVRVRARLDIYAARGTLQLVVEELELAGEGALWRAFERLKQRLLEEGLFDEVHKQELPFLPRRIGLVTSIGGAAIHDFVRALRRRGAAADVLVWDARVQGETAWREVVRGLQLLDAEPSVDVIVLARGGGSIEDLWTFNREELVRAIFEAQTPVVSAIGHEVDLVLTDLVADLRAATPTAAAELAFPDAHELLERIGELRGRLLRQQRATVAAQRERLRGLERGLIHPAQRLAELWRRVRAARGRLSPEMRRHLREAAERLSRSRERLAPAARRGGERGGARLEALAGRLNALSPLSVLERGYGIVRREADGAILTAAAQVAPGDELRVRLAQDELLATVNQILETSR
jgi:exodeoxyribonuclease VII large subunit